MPRKYRESDFVNVEFEKGYKLGFVHAIRDILIVMIGFAAITLVFG